MCPTSVCLVTDGLWLFRLAGEGHYPGTGHAKETGVAGNIVNVPLPHDSGSDAFRMVGHCFTPKALTLLITHYSVKYHGIQSEA